MVPSRTTSVSRLIRRVPSTSNVGRFERRRQMMLRIAQHLERQMQAFRHLELIGGGLHAEAE
jgi:hypothetical protein